jgi:adenosylcobinamide-phosphate synthase
MSPPGPYSGLEPSTVIWAAGWDFLLGEAPDEMDPNVLADRVITAVEQAAPQNSGTARSAFGNVVAFGLPLVARTVTGWLIGSTGRINRSVGREVATTLFKSTMSIRSTLQATSDATDIASNRVVRATNTNDESENVSGVLKRISNDYTENVMGPLCYFAFMGVPGAVAYRLARSLRDRWSASDDDQDPLGPAADRAFAVANFLPSVLSGALLAWSARWTERRGKEAWTMARQENEKRDWKEPRWAEGAIAGALDVRIGGASSPEAVNLEGRDPAADDLPRARRLFLVATGIALVSTVIVSSIRRSGRRN